MKKKPFFFTGSNNNYIKILIIIFFLFCLSVKPFFAQTRESGIVQGTVTSTDGETLIAVNVLEVDNQNRFLRGAITDYNGHYVIKVINTKNKLVFSYVGFKSQTVEINGRSNIDIQLAEDLAELEAVVVTAEKVHTEGSFSIPKKEISTAVQTIDLKSIEGVQVTSIGDALQGKIAGLDIVANSGDLGSGSSMRIRGTTSINAGSEPLIVVNDIPYEVQIDPSFDFATANQEQFANMLSINPDDIEEITVLKDAASAAVWGSKGANGVILIKTKKGSSGPTRIQYTYRMTRVVQPEGLKMLNGDDYTMMMKQAYFNPQQDEYAADIDEFQYEQSFSEYEEFNNNTNWFDEVTQTGFKHDHYVTVSGGGEKAIFRISGGFLNESGTVIGQHYSRITSRAYLDYWVSDRIKFTSEFSFNHSVNERNYENLLNLAYRKMPNVSVYKQDSSGNNTDVYYNISRNSSLHEAQRDMKNPVALANLAKNNLINNRILPTFRLQYDLTDPEVSKLRYNVYVSFDVDNSRTVKFLPQEVSNLIWNDDAVNRAENDDGERLTIYAKNDITWQPKFYNDAHSLLTQLTYEVNTGNGSRQLTVSTNHPSDEMINSTTQGYVPDVFTTRYQYRSNGALLRLHYAFKSKYIFDFNLRRDGSTKFGADNKYGNFPGISAKWIISDEEFMNFTGNWLSTLAIRPSYGVTGNQPREEYLHFSRYGTYGNYAGEAATRPLSLQLSDLKWETIKSVNYGIDLGFFEDRFVFDMNYYIRTTEDLLFENLKLPSSSGYADKPWQNVGTMDNIGWDIAFNTYNAIKTSDFKLDLNFNFSNNINTIVELSNDVLSNYNGDYDYNNGTYLSRIQEGNSYGSIYGFKYKGVYQYDEYIEGVQENAPVARNENGKVIYGQDGEPLPMYFNYGGSNEYEFKGGDAIYEDINFDGTIDELDIVYLGNSNPKFNGGFGTTISYKRFSCIAFFNFRYGNKIVNAARMDAENMYYLNNQSTAVNWRWRKNGDITDIPRALYNYGYNWLGSDRYVEDGSFLRFKYLTFNYSLPEKLLNKYKLREFKMYLTFNNLFVLTKYTGVDPEIGYDSFSVSKDYSMTPRSKDFTLGITVSF